MNRKEFIAKNNDGIEVKLAVRQPNIQDHDDADMVYSVKLATLIREPKNKRLLLRSELDAFLKESNTWTTKDEELISKLRKDIDKDLKKLKKGGIKKSEGRKIAIGIADKRGEIYTLNKKRQIFDDVTIENVSENEKIGYFIYTCTVLAENGEKYWSSFEDMNIDKESDVYKQASRLIINQIYGLSDDWEKNTPENKWLQKNLFINNELFFIDPKTGEAVDRDGISLKKIQEEAIKEVNDLYGDIEEETPFIDDEIAAV